MKGQLYRLSLESLESRLVPSLMVPAYNSFLGAKATLYLNFTGDFTLHWDRYSFILTPAYDTDGDPTTFSASELSDMQQIWASVAERYAPFNLNVTTVKPATMVKGVDLQVDIGGDGRWVGIPSGGISAVGSFTDPTFPSLSFVFPDNLGDPAYVGNAVAHEAGHAFGLRHQAVWTDGVFTSQYYAGPGDGTSPIMSYSYLPTRTLWWYGTNDAYSLTYQDDMAVIASAANGFGYRANTWSGGVLAVDDSGNVSGSGIIEHMDSLDSFAFKTAAGPITLTVTVPAGYNTLDAKLELLDAKGNVLATADPDDSFNATISVSVTGGSYSLVVASHGPSGGATATSYGQDVGSYSLSGSIPKAHKPRADAGLRAVELLAQPLNNPADFRSADHADYRLSLHDSQLPADHDEPTAQHAPHEAEQAEAVGLRSGGLVRPGGAKGGEEAASDAELYLHEEGLRY